MNAHQTEKKNGYIMLHLPYAHFHHIKSIKACNLAAWGPKGLEDVFFVSQQCFYKLLQASKSVTP